MAKDPISIARENMEAGNAQDWPRFKATLADSVVYDEVGTGRKIKGADQWVEAYQGWFQAFPDVQGGRSATSSPAATRPLWKLPGTGHRRAPSSAPPAPSRRQGSVRRRGRPSS